MEESDSFPHCMDHFPHVRNGSALTGPVLVSGGVARSPQTTTESTSQVTTRVLKAGGQSLQINPQHFAWMTLDHFPFSKAKTAYDIYLLGCWRAGEESLKMDARSLRRTASQETLMSLLQLDPTPIVDKELPPLPEESEQGDSISRSIEIGHARTSSLGLSGSGNGSIFYCMTYLTTPLFYLSTQKS